MKSKSVSPEKTKSARMRQIYVESQRPSKVRRTSMDGGGPAPCGQLETEWNKESVCTWGCVSAEYQSPSRVRGYVYIRVAWRRCQSLNMLRKAFT